VAEPPVNLLDRLKGPKYDLTESTLHVESSEEAAAKRHEASEQAKYKRKERLIILCFALVMVVVFFRGLHLRLFNRFSGRQEMGSDNCR